MSDIDPIAIAAHPIVRALSDEARRVYRAMLAERERRGSQWFTAWPLWRLVCSRAQDPAGAFNAIERAGLVVPFEELDPPEWAVITPEQLHGARVFWEAEEAAR